MNAKIYNGNVQPNPKEFKIWVNDEGTIKTWNGTEWIESAASSGGSGSGSSSGDSNFKYYKVAEPFHIIQTTSNYSEAKYLITHMRAQLNNDRYMYGTFAGVVTFFSGHAQNPFVDAFAFSPTTLFSSDKGWITIKSYEELAALYPSAFPPINYVTEITAEEYWEYFNAE